MAKQRRKAGLTTLKQILESKDHVRIMLNDHFMDIVRQYSAAGQIQEASLVTQFWSETQALSEEVNIKCRNDVVLGRSLCDDDELVLDDDCDSRGHSTRTCKAAIERTMYDDASVHWHGLSQG